MKQLSEDKDMKAKCNEMANTFMTHRQVGEAEAIYKLLASMPMSYSSISAIYVPTEPKGHRRQFLQRQDPDSGAGFRVEGREGLFLEKPDAISKYERRKLLPREGEDEEKLKENDAADIVKQLTFCQFMRMYESRSWQQRRTNDEGEAEHSDDEEERLDEGQLAVEDDFNFLITSDPDAPKRRLPQLLTLRDPLPGEPRIFHKRTFPRALRFFKKKIEKNAHHFYFTELILFKPFFDENEFFPEDPERCEAIYHEHKRELQMVKAQAMPFLESVEEAQQIYEEMRREEANIEEKMGADLDPQMEQEAADDDELDEFDEHPDYFGLNPDQLDSNGDQEPVTTRVFKRIVLPDKAKQVNVLLEMVICSWLNLNSAASKPVFFRSKRQECWTSNRRKH